MKKLKLKVRVNQSSYLAAMRGQRTVKPSAFPVGNRQARRLEKSLRAKERPL
jgi:hypothetical protein